MLVDSVYVPRKEQGLIKDLTYYDLFNYLKNWSLEQEKVLASDVFNKDWLSKFSKAQSQFLKDSTQYERYIDSNRYTNYLELSFLKVFKKEGWLGTERVAEILITPKNHNSIRAVSGYLFIMDKNKIEKKQELIGGLDGSAFFSFKGYTNSNAVTEAGEITNNYRLLEFIDIPKEIILQKYEVDFKVTDLIVEDRYVDVSFEKVPNPYIMYRRDKSEGYKEYFIQSEIDSNFKSRANYARELLSSSFESKYEKEHAFYKIGSARINEKLQALIIKSEINQ